MLVHERFLKAEFWMVDLEESRLRFCSYRFLLIFSIVERVFFVFRRQILNLSLKGILYVVGEILNFDEVGEFDGH